MISIFFCGTPKRAIVPKKILISFLQFLSKFNIISRSNGAHIFVHYEKTHIYPCPWSPQNKTYFWETLRSLSICICCNSFASFTHIIKSESSNSHKRVTCLDPEWLPWTPILRSGVTLIGVRCDPHVTLGKVSDRVIPDPAVWLFWQSQGLFLSSKVSSDSLKGPCIVLYL